MSSSLARARAICVIAYAVAFGVAFLAWRHSADIHPFLGHPFWRVVVADVAGTVVIFGFSRAFRNSSFYDAYWSVAPIAIALVWNAGHARSWLVTSLVTAWGLRLTYNWVSHWKGLQHVDWRYLDLRRKTGRLYWLVSFAGIHMFPTLLVLSCCVGLYLATTRITPLGVIDAFAAGVTASAIVIEALADKQLHAFVAQNDDPQRIMDEGHWSWSRHPNYFGEISFWWGMALFGFAADSSAWWVFVGPVCMTSMFLFISIPMMEERMLNKRPHYRDHIQRVSRLVPLPPSR